MDTQSRNSFSLVSDLKREFTHFLQSFEEYNLHGFKEQKYMRLIKEMLQSDRSLLTIDYQDLIAFNNDLAHMVFQEYYKYESNLNDALTHLARQCEKNILSGEEIAKRQEEKEDKYQITFDSALNANEQSSVRDLRCEKLGKLMCFRGTITRTTQVRPELQVGVFKCKHCGTLSKPVIQQFKYTTPKKCYGKNCDKMSWQLMLGESQFADFQRLRVQEDPTKIPPGAMPRSMDVVIRNQMVQKGQPGDKCRFIGYLCVLPEVISMLKPGEKTTLSTRNIETRGQQMMQMQGVTGLKGIKELNYKLIFIATNLIVENNQFREEEQIEVEETIQEHEGEKQNFNQDMIIGRVFNKLSQQEIFLIREMKENSNLYEDMANSLFPSIFGHIQIKKALLLQLFGGIHKITKNKINIRGDINILIVGDPSTAKSQFLKIVNKFVPRSVYTNGKTTSAAGLTASVSRDQNGNVGIEAGALMLADNGICCIDEFDKMNVHDQVAIHEAMEQQTISIAKAGVYATLNARTSILAAANPIFGRYDKSKSLKNNLNLSAPIMSRFDLFFIICDEVNENADAHLSDFIIGMHRNKEHFLQKKYDSKSLKLYISTAKKLKPMMNVEAGELLAKYYITLRQKDKITQNNSYKVTVRQLESMIRISEALARLYLDTQIKVEYVRQAYSLISSSIIKLEKSPIDLQDEQAEEGGLIQNAYKTSIAMNKELQMKKEEKKSKQISISHELYTEILKNVVELFKKQQQLESNADQEITITQEQLVMYLLGVNFESGMVTTEEQSTQMKKIITAVIKKLIKQERVLMIVQDSTETSKRVLRMHPNYDID